MAKPPSDPKMSKPPAPASPAATLPMFRDDVESEAAPSEAAPSFGHNPLRPPAKQAPRDDDDPIVQLARMTQTELAPARTPTPAPRVTQAGPIVRVPPEKIERVTQIGSVTRTEMVLRSELEREAFQRPSEPTLRPPTERKSEPALRPPAERKSEPALRPLAERKSEPALRPPAERPSEPALRPPAERPSEPTLRPPTTVAVEPASEAPPVAPPRLEPRSWGGRILVPDVVKPGFAAPPSNPSRSHASSVPPPSPASSIPRALKQRSAGEQLARLFYFAAGGLLVAAVAVYGGRFLRQTQPSAEPPTRQPPAAEPTAALAVPGGRIELSSDRHAVARFAALQQRWGAPLPTALDTLELTGPLVVGRAADALIALDLETGRTRFTWSPPTGERWAPQHPVAVNDCLIATTLHDRKTAVRCLDLATGQQRWAASLNGDHDCTQPPLAVPGAVIMACSGWTAAIDDRTGAVATLTGGVGLVADEPPTLLRALNGRLITMPWSDTKRRFTQTGDLQYGTIAVPISSAVLHKDRLVLRAVDSSDELAVIVPREGAQLHVAAPAFRLADATPLTRRCGGETSPRIQLLELTPRIGASFDPATAGERALALLDVETGSLLWTSRKATGLHGARAATAPTCRAGHYFLPLELTDRAGKPLSILWIVDAETGKTASALSFDPAVGPAATTDQIDDERLVGVGPQGAFELRWRTPDRGLHDARSELEAVLGPLP